VDDFERKVKQGMFALESKLDKAIQTTKTICNIAPKAEPIQDPRQV